MRKRIAAVAALALVALAGIVSAIGAAVEEPTVATETFTNVVTYTIPTVQSTTTVTVTETLPPVTTTVTVTQPPTPPPTTTTPPEQPPPPPPPPPPANDCTVVKAAGVSIESFQESLTNGAVGCIPGGTYVGSLSWDKDFTQRTTLKPVPGETVVIQDGRWTLGGTFQRLEGFVIDQRCPRSAAGNGPCPVVGMNVDGVSVQANDVEVVGNTIKNISRNGILIGSLYSRTLIARNYVNSVGANTDHSDNRSHAVYAQGNDHTILRNVLVSESGYGLALHTGPDDTVVAGNTAINCLPFFPYTAAEPCTASEMGMTIESATNTIVVNNILDGARLNPGSYVFDNNANLRASWSVSGGPSPTNTIAAPVFADDTLRLELGSPGIDAGRADHAYWPTFDGVYAASGAPDIGAYER